MQEVSSQNITPPSEPVVATQPPVSPSNQSPFGSWWKVGALVVGLLLAGSIVYAGNQYSQKQKTGALYPTPTSRVEICAQVITSARNPQTGECKDFGTPCDVPSGWTTVNSCSPTDSTANWKTFNSKKGYILKYPSQFFEEKRVEGFFAFLENPQNKQNIAFYIDERGEKTISERREETSKSLDKATFSELGLTGVNGFIVDGTVKSEFGKGTYVKGAYVDLNGKELIFGCEGQFCKSNLFNQILSTFRFLK